MSLLEKYWVDSPQKFERRIKEITDRYPDRIEPFELGKSASGIPVPGFRMGRGAKHVFLLGRAHGHEPSGTCGLTALIEGLASGKSPDTGKPFNEGEEILNRLTLEIFPLLNPTAADRYSRQIEDSYIGELATTAKSQNCFEEWLSQEYEPVLHEPGLALNKRRPPFFSPEELEILEEIGKPMGSLFTEEGIELWKDWVNGRAPQTRDLKALMMRAKPVLLVDIHNDSPPTRICPPSEIKEKDAALYQQLGTALYDALERASISSSREVKPYLKHDEHKSVSWAYENLGTLQFLYEINGIGSKEDMILSVWFGITALLLEVST